MFIRILPFALAALFLAGCQSNSGAPEARLTPAQKKELGQQRAGFAKLMIRVLAREGDLANALERDGSFNLIITIDDKNRVIACDTQPNKTFDRKLYPYNAQLAKDLQSICWTSVLPEMPWSLADTKEKFQEIVAPVAVYPLTGLSAEARARRATVLQDKAKNDFLFKQLLAPLPIDSIGVATLMIMSDSSGRVLECAASLDPHALRPHEFKQDDALLASLVQHCKQLDMNALPGYAPNAKAMTSSFHRIEYTPWKAGLKSDVKTPAL